MKLTTEQLQELCWLYKFRCRSISELARKFKISNKTVKVYLEKHDIEIRPNKYSYKQPIKKAKHCPNCDMLLKSKYHKIPCGSYNG